VTLLAAACGGGGGETKAGNGYDSAFAAEMIAHHRGAIDMAKVAMDKATHQKVSKLAREIVSAQQSEIETLTRVRNQLDAAGVKPQDLGLSKAEMGMDHNMAMLMEAKPFDRMFIDMMIPHHQGAIRMARVELEKGQNPELEKLAQNIVDAQTREIDQMNQWRVGWYGGLSPAGGVPAETGSGSSSDGTGGHSMEGM
jgi:uncharacterized protein (DUF305 family)